MSLLNDFNITAAKAGAVSALALLALAVPTWTSYQHDQKIHVGFRQQLLHDQTPRVITVETEGVTREGFLNRGAVLDRLYPGSDAFLIAQTPEAACWYTTLRVTKGQENLPFWQKLFGGAEWEWQFASEKFGVIGSRCAPVSPEKQSAFQGAKIKAPAL